MSPNLCTGCCPWPDILSFFYHTGKISFFLFSKKILELWKEGGPIVIDILHYNNNWQILSFIKLFILACLHIYLSQHHSKLIWNFQGRQLRLSASCPRLKSFNSKSGFPSFGDACLHWVDVLSWRFLMIKRLAVVDSSLLRINSISSWNTATL